jgi:alpha-mannosidase
MVLTEHRRSKALTFTMVGHAHLDPIWLWDWREGYEALKATFRSALDRMQENPDFVFVHSSAAHYQWMEQDHPELFAEIRNAVARGQWEPVGGWWVEPDTNIPSGEALARQGLYAQRYFERSVGRRAKVAFLPDSFGHPATLPQIIKLAGMDAFVFMRPETQTLPSNLFWWEGPDGTRILAARIECYNTNPENVAQSLGRNLKWRPESEPHWLALYGVGNHGGGPTRRLIENIRALNADPDWPALQFGGLSGFMASVAADDRERPVWTKGLQFHSQGGYTSYAPVKRLNREAEQTLLGAEKWSALATAYGRPYPTAALERSWHNLLLHQFHDTLCGTAIEPAYKDVQNDLGEALSTAGRTMYGAMQAIAQRVDTTLKGRPHGDAMRRPKTGPGGTYHDMGDGVPVVVFNPSAWPRHAVVDVEVNDWSIPELRVLDEEGNPVLHQFARPEAVAGERKRAAFVAEVPSLGYRVYRLIDEPPAELPADARPLSASATELENTWWRITFDPQTGAMASLHDKVNGLELLNGGGAQLLVMEDPGNPWGSQARHFRRQAGLFGQPELILHESGPVRATVAIITRYGSSVARQEITLYRDIPAIEGRLKVNWQEQLKALKLAFPLALAQPVATLSAPYGHVASDACGDEEPIQQWLDVTGLARSRGGVPHPYGVALLNDCKYGADVMGSELRLTVLRSTVFASDRPSKADPKAGYPFQDQGWHELRWALKPHAGPWQDAGMVQAAHDLNDPLRFIREYVHPGTLPPHHSFLTVTPPEQVVVTTFKQAEDGDDLVLRLYEPAGRPAQAEVRIASLGVSFAVAAGPHQIKSYRITRSGAVREVNFLEEPVSL